MVYPIAKHTIVPLVRSLWIKKINGLNNLPKDKPFIFAGNHGSFLDDLILPVVIIPHINKLAHIYCNDSFFKNPISGSFIRWGRVIPIRVYKSKDQKKINKEAFRLAKNYLKKGEPVGIFPEGHRSKDGKLQKARSGVAALALKAKVPVIPIGTIGTFKIWPKGIPLPNLNKCTVNIGKPIYFDKFYGKENNQKILKDITTVIMKKIAKLNKQKYNHGA